MIHNIVVSQAFDQVAITTTGQDRKTDASLIEAIFKKEMEDAGIKAAPITTYKDAIEALKAIKEEGYKVIITGSLYLVADIKKAIVNAL